MSAHELVVTIPGENIPMGTMIAEVNKSFTELLKIQAKLEEEFIRLHLVNAVPPIKGEITKGKLKWRGISIHQYHNGDKRLYQRDKPISPIFPNNLYKIDYHP